MPRKQATPPPPTPEEQFAAMRELFKEKKREMNTQVSRIQQSESMTEMEMRALAKKGEIECARILARAVVQARHARGRIRSMVAKLDDLESRVRTGMATKSIASVMGQINPAFTAALALTDKDQIRAMQFFERQMAMASDKQAAVDEAVDDALDFEDLDTVADEEVNKLLQAVGVQMASGLEAPAAQLQPGRAQEHAVEGVGRVQQAPTSLAAGEL